MRTGLLFVGGFKSILQVIVGDIIIVIIFQKRCFQLLTEAATRCLAMKASRGGVRRCKVSYCITPSGEVEIRTITMMTDGVVRKHNEWMQM